MILIHKKALLSDAKAGDLYRIDYSKNFASGPIRRTIKIHSVRDTKKDPILASTQYQNQIERSQMLITGIAPKGQPRRYYGETVSEIGRKYTLLGKLVMAFVTGRVQYYIG